MMDEIDAANDLAQLLLTRTIEASRLTTADISGEGNCRNCGIECNGRWCSAGCRDDYEIRLKKLKG